MFETPMASVALKTILEKAWSGVRMSRSNLRYLLRIDEHKMCIRDSLYHARPQRRLEFYP